MVGIVNVVVRAVEGDKGGKGGEGSDGGGGSMSGCWRKRSGSWWWCSLSEKTS
jgi:hypothetical protein